MDIRKNAFSITSLNEKIYLASVGKEGGIYEVPTKNFESTTQSDEPLSSSFNKIIYNSSNICDEVHSIHAYSSNRLTGLVFSDMKRCTIALYALDGKYSIISGQQYIKGSSDGVYGSYNQPTSIWVIGETILACDTATKMVKLISPGTAIIAYLENIDRFLRTFGVTLPGEKNAK